MVNEVVEIVRSNLSASLGVAFEIGEVDRSGMNVQCIRLSQPHRKIDNMQEELFSLIVNPPGTFAEVDLTMDRQAGRLVRLIQDYVEYETTAWSDFLAVQDSAIQTTVIVNDDTVAPSDLPTDLWKALEVNARKRIPSEDRVSNSKKASHISDVAITCMSLILMTGILESFEPVDQTGLPEGKRTKVIANRYERRGYNRVLCIREYGYKCWVCDMSFPDIYPGLGSDYIQVHHVVPVSQLGPNYVINPIEDLVPLCSNCHSMIHWPNQKTFRTPAELRNILGKNPKEENPFKKWDAFE